MSIEITITPSDRQRYQYDAYLGEDLLCTSRIPFFDGARVLLRLGYDPDLPLTMRHVGSAYPSFVPVPIGQAAKLTVRENDEDGLRVRLYEPYSSKQRNRELRSVQQYDSKLAGSVTHGNGAVLGA